MREWHVKFVTGLISNATLWEKRQNERYGRIVNVCRQIGYDIKQGATQIKKYRKRSNFLFAKDV
jgi:hypothetical protein